MSDQTSLCDTEDSLQNILKSQSQLYDLHTHLMGNGSYKFWVNEILENADILPPHDHFIDQEKQRIDICPLVWNEDDRCFVNGTKAAKFFHDLIIKDFPIGHTSDKPDFQDTSKNEQKALLSLIEKASFKDELRSLELSFRKDFSYDVVLKLSDLGKGLGVKENAFDDLIQIEVEEKLGISRSKADEKMPFRSYIVFNAREQYFEITYGITAETLRNLIKSDRKTPNRCQNLARSHIINCFSMCSPKGTPADHIDFHGFHGAFTPEFYPRRFALKDSIYGQRLDVLFLLLSHIFKCYTTCEPQVKYCELSVSVNDLSSPWIFEILRSIKSPSLPKSVSDDLVLDKNIRESGDPSKFCSLIENHHFPHLKDKQETIVVYKFLVGFKRQNVQSPIPSDQMEALCLLNEAPQLAIHYMLQEIVQSEKDSRNTSNSHELPDSPGIPDRKNVFVQTEKDSHNTSDSPRIPDRKSAFVQVIDELLKLQNKASIIPKFYHWVVGIDLFGDELGYPYCPFVAWPFIKYVSDLRKTTNQCFGMRIHCGENLVFADNDIGSYRLFVAHMYIVFRCLRYLQRKLTYGIRIGHGVAFERILGDDMNKMTHRKSSVLLAEIKKHAKYVLPTIAFELNITSNEYLLRYPVRQATHEQTHKIHALFALNIPIILSTDDDGVWPIKECKQKQHKKHHSLAAEYCRAISSSIFKDEDSLQKAFENTRKFCFFPVEGKFEMPEAKLILPEDDERISTIILHPDLIKVVLRQCYKGYNKNMTKFQEDPFVKHYLPMYSDDRTPVLNDDSWKNLCEKMAPLAYVAHCTDESSDSLQKIEENFPEIFGTNPDHPNLMYIYDNWIKIRKQLIDPNMPNRGQHVQHVSSSGCKYVFLSEQPLSEKSVPEHLIDFLQDNYHESMQIRAYARHVNVLEMIKILKEQLKRPWDKQLSVILYTNKDKTKKPVFYIDDKKLQILINPGPSKRTYKERTQENTFYVICPHARAATVALHFVIHSVTDGDLPQNTQPHPTNVQNYSEDNELSSIIDISPSIQRPPPESDDPISQVTVVETDPITTDGGCWSTEPRQKPKRKPNFELKAPKKHLMESKVSQNAELTDSTELHYSHIENM